ncbi:hypothetical protein EDB19DRAFT_1913495 [Suillus lakei]|nr:hypothetical protein EDB19DRAFT_1913495 [Suillus lakei]
MSSPRQTSPRSVALAHSILNSDLSNKSQSMWGASDVESSQGSTPAKAEGSGNADATSTALGSLGLRRSKALASKATDKSKSSSPNPKPASPISAEANIAAEAITIILPPTTWTYCAAPSMYIYAPASTGAVPIPSAPTTESNVSRRLCTISSHDPLHSPYHMHYGVITPHGLPPITPSMPPFTFLQPTNGRANTTEQGSNGGSYQGQATEGRSEAPPPSSPYHLPPHSQVPYSSHLPSHMFSPGIPLSPGIMVPISTGYPPSGDDGAADAWWGADDARPPGAPVHADEQWHNHGHPPNSGGDYFPPQGGPDDDTGYFPPVCSIAKEIFKEGSEFHSSEREGESQSRGSSACAGMVSPAPKSTQEGQQSDNDRGHRDARRTVSPQPNRFTTTEGGHAPRRAGLTHRPDSDPTNVKRQS